MSGEPDGPFAAGCLLVLLMALGTWAGIIALLTWALR